MKHSIYLDNFPNLNKEMPINIQENHRTPNRWHQKINSSCHTIIKTPNAMNKVKVLKAVREKSQVTYNGRPIRTTPYLSTVSKSKKILGRCQTDTKTTKLWAQATIPSKTLNYRENKIFHDKTKLTQYLSTNPVLQRIILRKP